MNKCFDSGTVMVVDDNEDIRDLYKLNFNRLGLSVVVAESGEEAIFLFQQLKPGQNIDIVILDLNLGAGLGGKEIAKEIRELSPDTRLVVSSGDDESEVMKNYQHHGFDGVLKKDFRPDSIKQLVEQLL